MFPSLTRTMRVATCAAVLIAAFVTLPVTHDLHDSTDTDCRICQLRHDTTAVLSQSNAFGNYLKSDAKLGNEVVDLVVFRHLPTAPSRAPPA